MPARLNADHLSGCPAAATWQQTACHSFAQLPLPPPLPTAPLPQVETDLAALLAAVSCTLAGPPPFAAPTPDLAAAVQILQVSSWGGAAGQPVVYL